MIVVVFCSILAFILTYLDSNNKLRNGMVYSFIILAFLGVIHYDYGNDYMAYYKIYNTIIDNSGSVTEILSGDVYKDVGWCLLCLLFSYLGGFFVLVAAISIFENYVYYLLIKIFVPKKNWAFSVVIYLFNYTYYLLNFSMLRQGLAVALGVMAIILFKKTTHKYILPIVLLLLAYNIHSSSLICALAYILCFFRYDNTRLLSIILSVLFIVFIISRDAMASFIEPFLVFDTFDGFLEKYSERGQVSGLGLLFLINSIPLFLAASLFYKKYAFSSDEKHLILLSCIGIMVVPFSTIALMISRLAIYFSVFSIAAFPVMYSKISDHKLRVGLVSLFIVSLLYSYYDFFTSDTYSVPYKEFKTIFSVL